MTSMSGSPIRLKLTYLVSIAVLFLAPAALVAQEVQYTEEEYAAYQKITAAADADDKAALVAKFFQEYPKSSLRPHVIADFQAALQKLESAQRWQEIINSGRQVLNHMHDDLFTVALLATAYQKTKNYKQFVTFGEEVYQKSPSGNLAYYLAKAYLELGNLQKFFQWGETTVAKMPDNHEILLELTKQYSAARRNADSAKHAARCLKVVQAASRPEQMSDKDWNAYTTHVYATCYYVVGHSAFENNKYDVAVNNLENSTRHFKKNELAYYFLGQSYWQLRRMDLAMKNFAKAYLLNGSSAVAAKQHLDNLYKSMNNNSLAGLERVIERARAELK